MRIHDIRFNLKDGRKALLRSPKEEDAEGTLEYLGIQPVKPILFCGIRRNVRNIH